MDPTGKSDPFGSEVPGAGLEPARLLRTQDFESSASTNSATRATWLQRYKIFITFVF